MWGGMMGPMGYPMMGMNMMGGGMMGDPSMMSMGQMGQVSEHFVLICNKKYHIDCHLS
jgi:hypothetical protein